MNVVLWWGNNANVDKDHLSDTWSRATTPPTAEYKDP